MKEGLDLLMVALSSLGNNGALWFGLALLLLVKKAWRPAGGSLLLGILLAALAQDVLKDFFARPRPVVADPSTLLVEMPTTFSFPSGHTMLAFCAAGILYSVFPRLAAPVLVLACLIGFSRLYLGVHYTSDVIGGALIGLAISVFVVWIKGRVTRWREKTEKMKM
ncbi:phosphatase PAP2 family protein [Ammoniphilus sp. YIM 78166]|uniref:phosphatase PAP2 family protein n=1 Tax=Ammoniphilus sp. YIM 78166 TaxID=1644106 RepID=UPI00106F7DA9|nr:phosphatase PAP2 family protein [Ammoniphilus sp. YIM 78166]